MQYIIPVGPKDLEISKLTIKSIKSFDSNSDIFVVSAKCNIKFYNNEITFIDEDKLVEGLNLDFLNDYFEKRKLPKDRLGWYFQQFLKMGFSLHTDEKWHNIFCADTILLKSNNIDNDWPYLLTLRANPAEKFYYETYTKIFGPNHKLDYSRSYVTENLIVKTSIMREVISFIENKFNKPFYIAILDILVEDGLINKAGFAEYLTYSMYVLNTNSFLYTIKKDLNFRNGKRFFSDQPAEKYLNWASRKFRTISFEKWDNEIYVNITKILFPLARFIRFDYYVFLITFKDRFVAKVKRRFN